MTRPSMPDAEEAQRVTGYRKGAITPFGSRRSLPTAADTGVDVTEVVSIGGGARGIAIHLEGGALIAAPGADVAAVTKPG
jgi:prolyl-tRNA editing enzyme YbaK/EbsC (Cys-tRNA(Pro) deacylase)